MSNKPWYHEDSGNYCIAEIIINREESSMNFRIIADGLSKEKADKVFKLLKKQLQERINIKIEAEGYVTLTIMETKEEYNIGI